MANFVTALVIPADSLAPVKAVEVDMDNWKSIAAAIKTTYTTPCGSGVAATTMYVVEHPGQDTPINDRAICLYLKQYLLMGCSVKDILDMGLPMLRGDALVVKHDEDATNLNLDEFRFVDMDVITTVEVMAAVTI